MLSPLCTIPLIAVVAMVGSCTDPSAEAEPPAPINPAREELGWHPLPASTLSPRTNAHAFWTGSTVLVIGGVDDVGCPPNGDCVQRELPLSDGAAYDPVTKAWTEMPDAPVPLGHVSGGVVAGSLYLWVPGFEPGARSAFLSFTPGDKEWVELPPPPFDLESSMNIVAAGDQLVAFQGTHEFGLEPDLSYDPRTEAWTELPPDPLTPAFDRQMIWTDEGLVLLGRELVPNPGSAEPSRVLAARLDGQDNTWERFPDSETIGGPWQWTGDKLVNASIGGADGGQVIGWGRSFPYGGILDPATGEWSELPGTPDVSGDFRGFSVAGGGWAVSADGWALHAASDTWVALRPPAAGVAEDGQAAVWAGDRLFVFGGSRVVDERFVLVGGGWSWSPENGT